MKVKFNLDDMEGINHLTSGKEYLVVSIVNPSLVIIQNDIDHSIGVLLNNTLFNCAHLKKRTAWKKVDAGLKLVH